uniref:AlNc14C213G8953 protein n=1 Tax=Albugo laibachii Nc14 TaxID=890382 RepID=F0WRF0_9STRA|nr:AlNc14C213G8953 [Albugo laibachii Nc14]|eukprot:CCA23913.1 AlNc14C213G8953 [Albugo laibachii Nc14]
MIRPAVLFSLDETLCLAEEVSASWFRADTDTMMYEDIEADLRESGKITIRIKSQITLMHQKRLFLDAPSTRVST